MVQLSFVVFLCHASACDNCRLCFSFAAPRYCLSHVNGFSSPSLRHCWHVCTPERHHQRERLVGGPDLGRGLLERRILVGKPRGTPLRGRVCGVFPCHRHPWNDKKKNLCVMIRKGKERLVTWHRRTRDHFTTRRWRLRFCAFSGPLRFLATTDACTCFTLCRFCLPKPPCK